MQERERTAELVVRGKQCPTCIYRADCILELGKLEGEVRNAEGRMTGFRICHTETLAEKNRSVCCRGFWNRWKEESLVLRTARAFAAAGLGRIRFTDADAQEDNEPGRPGRRARTDTPAAAETRKAARTGANRVPENRGQPGRSW